ncbi:MAG: ABC transporter ATP-binding protein [Tissierellia bacterium]|nr:ABC transporter ATP-binding protein [Tissierellia bacterium]
MACKIEHLSYIYPNGRKGLKDINIHIRKGRKTALLGLNGSGKSTLLYHLNGTFLPQEGSVEVLGLSVEKKNLREIRKMVGFLFDYPDHQLFSITAYKDIEFGLDNYHVEEEEKKRRIQEISNSLNITPLLEYPPYDMSLGQKKKVAIAGVSVLNPSIILCDEPFSGLDGVAITYFKEQLDQWVKEGKTLLFSTHDVDLTYEWADDVILLKDGRIIAHGETMEVMSTERIYRETDLQEPVLYQLFKDHKVKPRSPKEAMKYIHL